MIKDLDTTQFRLIMLTKLPDSSLEVLKLSGGADHSYTKVQQHLIQSIKGSMTVFELDIRGYYADQTFVSNLVQLCEMLENECSPVNLVVKTKQHRLLHTYDFEAPSNLQVYSS